MIFRPIRKMDLARAMAVIGQHPDSDGHDFELYNDQTYNLAQLVEYMYDCKWQSMATNSTPGFKVPGVYNKRDVDLDLFQWDGKYCFPKFWISILNFDFSSR